jgi:hypothetical protein
MANTWSANSQGVAYASGKSMLDVFNAAASTRAIRIYKMLWFNAGVTAITGVLTEMRINRLGTAAPSVGTAVTPVTMNPANAALNANTTAGTGRTSTVAALLRSMQYSNDEPAVSGNSIDELLCLVPFAELWTLGSGDANLEPITCIAGQNCGAEIKHQGTSIVGSGNGEIIFTDA